MKNIIVTGAKGKLSGRVAKRLKEEPVFSVNQISLRADGLEKTDFKNTDCIVHIAGITPQNAKSESDYENVNYLLTRRLADKAKTQGVKHFIFISSMAVYGMNMTIDADKGKVTSDTPCHAADKYGLSKLKAEEYLSALQDDTFRVSIIRVPSVFDSEKTEYIDQYKYLADKLPFIPKAFVQNYKSFIHSDNLCELIYLIIKNGSDGVFCPDEGKLSTFDICRAIYPEKKAGCITGALLELFMKKNPRIIDYYGAIYYSEDLTNIFGGKYRVIDVCYEIQRLYKKEML